MNSEAINPLKFMRITAEPACTFACEYCNPNREFNPNSMNTDELLDCVQAGVELGIRVAHLTGGEPSMRKDIVNLVAGIKKRGVDVIEMTTNGFPYYRLVESLVEAGLTGVNISIDTFDRQLFHEITQVDALPKVLQAIESSQRLLPGKVALNMVVTQKNIHEMGDFVEYAREQQVLVRFCELTPNGPYMKVTPNYFNENHVSKSAIIHALETISNIDEARSRSFDAQNAHSAYLSLGGKYEDMTVGIIAPYSNGWPCPGAACTRLRIGPTSANSCVIYAERKLQGLSFEEKKKALHDLINERINQINQNLFPLQHMPAYSLYRFGLAEQSIS